MKVQADVPAEFAMRVEKLAQTAMKQEGKAAVALIEDAGEVAQRRGDQGQGSLVNTTA